MFPSIPNAGPQHEPLDERQVVDSSLVPKFFGMKIEERWKISLVETTHPMPDDGIGHAAQSPATSQGIIAQGGF